MVEYHPSLHKYVTSTTANVFAVVGLPEEVVAVLFAYYSRRAAGLRESLSTMLFEDEGELDGHGQAGQPFARASEKARAFHEKWVVGYGHQSVAEHAIVHLALENVSIIASKAIEDARLASYTEKSTRYVKFDAASLFVPGDMEEHELDLYRASCGQLYDLYEELVHLVTVHVGGRASADTSFAAVKAQALDACRGLLPAGTRTSLGLTVNARELAHILQKLAVHPLPEVRTMGSEMKAAALPVVPTLLKYTEPSSYLATHMERLRGGLPTQRVVDFDLRPVVAMAGHSLVNRERIVRALLAELGDEHGGNNTADCLARMMTMGDRMHLIEAVLDGRGPHDRAPRAFEAVTYQVRLRLDYGAYRDLQRHRMLSPSSGLLTAALGHDVPELIRAVGEEDRYNAALRVAADAWKKLAKRNAEQAQYAVPLAFKFNVFWTINLREVFHVIELRSAKQGHPSYRRIAQDLYRVICDVDPWLIPLIRVDMNDYAMART
jgi:thymidylate synthase ThyX